MSENTLKILLSSNSRDGAERINHLFRNSGQAAQTHRVSSMEDLNQCLNDEQWDLALCEQQNSSVNVEEMLEFMVQSETDTPCILLAAEAGNDGIVDGLKRGAQDVIPQNSEEHLLHAANREIRNLRIRRRHADMERSLQEVNGRFETLMAQADDAVAYVLDGMHVDVNEAYAATFGIDDPDEFLAIPVVDLIAEKDLPEFKRFLRSYADESEPELGVECVTQQGESFQVRIKFAAAVFDEEHCTQIILRRDAQSSSPELISSRHSDDVDPTTGLHTRYGMVDKLDDLILGKQSDACLLYLGINDFGALKTRLGLSGSRLVRQCVAEIISKQFCDFDQALLAHYGEDSFTILLPGASDNEALQNSRKLCERIEKHIFEIDEQTAQCSCCVGVVDFSKSEFQDASEVMDTAFLALEEARQLYAEDPSIPGIVLYRPGTGSSLDNNYDIRELVTDGRLRMMFQPVINLHGPAMESYESTVRLVDSEGEESSVDALFQAMNQRSGDTSLDKWLVVEGTKNLKAQGELGKNTVLTINLTQNALIDNTFSNWLGVALKAAQIAPDNIVLQFSESTIAHYLKQAIRFREELQEWKFKFSLSKFGSSQESFKVLQHFAIDYAFLDASFTIQLQKDPSNSEALKSVLNRLNEMNVCSVVPYVENAAMLASLWQMNTHYIQGYYLQAPAEVMEYEFAEAS